MVPGGQTEPIDLLGRTASSEALSRFGTMR